MAADDPNEYVLGADAARRLGDVVRIVESLRHVSSQAGTRGVVEPLFALKGKANGTISKTKAGKVDIWTLQDYTTPHSVSNAAIDGYTIDPVFVWGIQDDYEIPDGAEVIMIYLYGETSGWHVILSWPCPIPIPSSS